jgi:hypothetical protein
MNKMESIGSNLCPTFVLRCLCGKTPFLDGLEFEVGSLATAERGSAELVTPISVARNEVEGD